MKNGEIIEAKVTDKNDRDIFLQDEGVTYRLKKAELDREVELGESLKGFVYENTNHHNIFTVKIPEVQIGHYAWGEVVESRHDLGVFVNIGLPDKDVVVSMDELPELKNLWPHRGDHLMISLVVDKKNRLWGHLATDQMFQQIAKQPDKKMQNWDVVGTVYHPKMSGSLVITDHYFLGFIHPSQRDAEPRLGEKVKARVVDVNAHGYLNLSLKPRAYETISEDALMILEVLKRQNNHVMPYTDKSSPDSIKEYFGISKAGFKRAMGHLLKKQFIEEDFATQETKLTKKGEDFLAEND